MRRCWVKAILLTALMGLGPPSAFAQPGAQPIVLPEDDIGTLAIDGGQAFIPWDGAIVLRRGDRYIADATVYTQSKPDYVLTCQNSAERADRFIEGFPIRHEDGSLELKRRFAEKASDKDLIIHQRLTPAADGIHSRYTVEVEDVIEVHRLGLLVTLPIQHHAGLTLRSTLHDEEQGDVTGEVALPAEKPDAATIATSLVDTIEVVGADGLMLGLELDEPTWCIIEDMRHQERYYYSIKLEVPVRRGELTPDQPYEFGLKLTTSPPATTAEEQPVVPLPALRAETPVVPLPDDNDTRGNWMGTYGSEAYILCAQVKFELCGGLLCPIPHRIYIPVEDDVVRRWIGKSAEHHDQRPLFSTKHRVKRPTIADDHGESYPMGEGPDLCVDLFVPEGDHVLSLYFFEIDWAQYRDYTIDISRLGGGRLVTITVREFYHGVYKRMAVRGPIDLNIRIRRDLSPNATLPGIFLDPLAPEWQDPDAASVVAYANPRGSIDRIIGQPEGLQEIYDLLAVADDGEALAACQRMIDLEANGGETPWLDALAMGLCFSRGNIAAALGYAHELTGRGEEGSAFAPVGAKAVKDLRAYEERERILLERREQRATPP